MTKLQIGCFDTPIDGWYNTDVTPHIFISRIPFLPALLHTLGVMDSVRLQQHRSGIFRQVQYLNAVKRFPFRDNSIDAVYSSHMLYNLSQSQAFRCMCEIHRVLIPGGIVRLAVIDLDELIRQYDPQRPDLFLEPIYQPSIRGTKNKMQWSYNEVSLSALLRRAGFNNVTRRNYREGVCPDVEKVDYRPDSLFMEGIK